MFSCLIYFRLYLLQKHDIGAENVFSAIPDLRALVEETLVAMSRIKL